MEDISEIEDAILTKEVLKDGVKLIIIASKSGADDWQLSVQNEYGITSNWLEFFPSSQLAIEAGVFAVARLPDRRPGRDHPWPSA